MKGSIDYLSNHHRKHKVEKNVLKEEPNKTLRKKCTMNATSDGEVQQQENLSTKAAVSKQTSS